MNEKLPPKSGPSGSMWVRPSPFNLCIINTLFFPKCCIFFELLWLFISHIFQRGVTLSINRVSPHSFKKKKNFLSLFLKLLWVNYFLRFWESYLHKERESDTSYIRCARILLVLLLRVKIILFWETDVHESQSTTKIIVWGAQFVLRT